MRYASETSKPGLKPQELSMIVIGIPHALSFHKG